MILVFKGKGCDPLNPNNYRGITQASVIAKCLETAILSRLNPILEEKCFPTTHKQPIDAAFHANRVIGLNKYTFHVGHPWVLNGSVKACSKIL